jgi:hypothetical protein
MTGETMMNLHAELEHEAAMDRLAAGTRRLAMPWFADICWGHVDFLELQRNPGVMLESRRRVVVFQYINGELPWRSQTGRRASHPCGRI